MEGRPLSEHGFHPQTPAVQLDDPAGNGEAEPRAALRAGAGAVRLLELLEDLLLVSLGDPGATVGDRDDEGPIGGAGLDGHTAAVGELDRIAGEVQHNLGQPTLVAASRWKI